MSRWDSEISRWWGKSGNDLGQGKGQLLALRVTAASIET